MCVFYNTRVVSISYHYKYLTRKAEITNTMGILCVCQFWLTGNSSYSMMHMQCICTMCCLCLSVRCNVGRMFLSSLAGGKTAAASPCSLCLLYLRPHGVVAGGILFFKRSFFLSFFSFANGSSRWLYRQGTFIAQKVGYRCNLKIGSKIWGMTPH